MVDPTAADFFTLIERRYATPRNGITPATVMPEVSMHVAGEIVRADAIAVGFTQAQGRVMEGFEIKVSRADWLHELAHPAKSEPWARNCQRFWLVAPADIVQPGELPESWGHLAPNKDATSLRIVKRAPLRPGEPSWEAAHAFIARCNSAGSQVERYRREADSAKHAAASAQEYAKQVSEAHGACGKEAELLSEVRAFEKATGIELNAWSTNLQPRTSRYGRARVRPEDLMRSLLLLSDTSALERALADAERLAQRVSGAAGGITNAVETARAAVAASPGQRAT